MSHVKIILVKAKICSNMDVNSAGFKKTKR